MNIKLLPILLVLSTFQVYSASALGSCDEVFYGSLRAGAAYQFNDTMTNTTGLPVFVNLVSTTFSQEAGYGNPPAFYDAPLVSSSHVWSPGESGLVTESSTYYINARPAVRSTNNVVIWYDVTYSTLQNGEWGAGSVHRECKFYEITACGDGVVDSGDGESCDSGAANGQPGKCNNTCTATVPETPINGVCSTYANQTYPGSYAWSDFAPLACASGTPVQGAGWPDGPWSWSCTGSNGGTSAQCSANKTPPVAPVCNPANTGLQPNNPLTRNPYPQLCTSGTAANGQTNGNTSSWTCGNGVTSVTCSANWTYCGDGVRNGSEVCDPNDAARLGWGNGTPGCSVSCQPINITPVCGDGVRNGSEACDPNDPSRSGWGTLGCDVACSPINTILPVCSSTITGNLSAPISAGACNSGIPTGFIAVGTSPINYSWTCGNGVTSVACTASYTPTGVACVPGTTTGVQSAPITALTPGLCQAGQAVGGFTATTIGATTSYTWSCNGSAVGGACAATYTSPVVNAPYISIKKFANNSDGQIITDALPLNPGATFTYRYVITNTGTVAATGVVMTDTLPRYIAIGTPVAPAGWTCATGSKVLTGITYATLICTTPNLDPNATATITVPATLSGATPLSSQIRNIAYVCRAGETATPSCNSLCVDPNNPLCTPVPPPVDCSPIASDSHYDPACVVVSGTGFDLGVKKYIGTNDAQTSGAAVSTSTNASLTYQVVVTNFGPGTSTGTTTLQDILPTGVAFAGSGAWTNGNWNCTYTGTTNMVRCINSVDRVASGASLGATVFIPIRVTAGPGQGAINLAHIDNPSELTRCTASGSLPPDATSSCTLDARNSDPAFLSVPGGGGGGSAIVGKICSNGIASCATYNSINACIAAGVAASLCYTADTVGYQMCQNQSLTCPGGGGGGCPGPGCGGGGGRCGDGVLQPQTGEECDVVGAPWCVACQIQITTNIGSNPIEVWMTIPTLTRSRLGYSWIDGIPGKLPFVENRMVLGVGTKAFTLADKVGFGIRQELAIPLMIEVDKKVYLKSSGEALNSETLRTSFGDAAMLGTPVTVIDSQTVKYGDNIIWTRPVDGTQFLVLGRGDFQYQLIRTGPYYVGDARGANNIDLFRGSRQYLAFGGGSPTLNSAFFGRKAGADGTLTLATDALDIVSLPVRVSAALVGTTSTPVNRSIENFISQSSIRAFLTSIQSQTSLSPGTTTRSDTSPNALINVRINTIGDRTVKNLSELEAFALNGNKNILAIQGNLTIQGCIGNTFVMDGVRTVIVEGNLILKCNTVYGSSDTTSSWAWIVKKGDIFLDPGVTNDPNTGVSKISGVYVVVNAGGIGGQFRSIGDATSQKILRVEGSLYGYAKPLLDSRLYTRGTSAYEILTTGTILSYSNRALVNPPPLLSEYLGNYTVERVVR